MLQTIILYLDEICNLFLFYLPYSLKKGMQRALVSLHPSYIQNSLYLRRRLSAIIAINSELVGLPLSTWMV